MLMMHYLFLTMKILREKHRTGVAIGATAGTSAKVEMEQETLQVAYTVGGATLGIADIEVSNADYTEGKDETQTIISLGISF